MTTTNLHIDDTRERIAAVSRELAVTVGDHSVHDPHRAPQLPVAATVAGLLDHTVLATAATAQSVSAAVSAALENGYASVCVPGNRVLAARAVSEQVRICAVLSFPNGDDPSATKAAAARHCVAAGADELDMVMALTLAGDGDWAGVFDDVAAVVAAADGRDVKVIVETSELSFDQKVAACLIARAAGAAFVKTSTGMRGPATVADVALMRAVVGETMGVKASGGIRERATAHAMVAAGATRLGTSASQAIISGRDASAGGY